MGRVAMTASTAAMMGDGVSDTRETSNMRAAVTTGRH